jgi:parallel beta-helix repeat protein
LIEFNEIHDVCLETSDAGAIMIYTGYLKALSDNIIRYNFIQNVVGMNSNEKQEILSPYYTWGIYLDAHSSGTKVYGNIVINTVLGGIIVNGGKNNLIENNIFVNGIKNQLFANEWDKNYAQNNVFLRNIITFENATATLWENNKIMKTKTLEKSDYNLYWNSNNRNLIKTNSKITPAGSFSQWQAGGYDRNSLVADPLFVDTETGNFQLKPNSPAFKLGFKPIPIERIGPKGFK